MLGGSQREVHGEGRDQTEQSIQCCHVFHESEWTVTSHVGSGRVPCLDSGLVGEISSLWGNRRSDKVGEISTPIYVDRFHSCRHDQAAIENRESEEPEVEKLVF